MLFSLLLLPHCSFSVSLISRYELALRFLSLSRLDCVLSRLHRLYCHHSRHTSVFKAVAHITNRNRNSICVKGTSIFHYYFENLSIHCALLIRLSPQGVAQMLSSPIWGWLVDRLGPRKPLFCSSVVLILTIYYT